MNSTDTQTRLETLEREVESHRPRPRARVGWLAAAAAAAAVIAGLVVVDVSRDDGSDKPAGPVDTGAATELASDFMDAVAAYDVDRARSFLADDARVALWPAGQDDDLGAELRWTRAVGAQLFPGPCEHEGVVGRAATVVCTFDFHALGSKRLGRGPFTDNEFRLVVVDDEISEVGADSDAAEFEATMWEPFTAWLLSHHADQAAFMYDDWPNVMRPALTDRSAGLWAKHVEGYVRAVERGNAF